MRRKVKYQTCKHFLPLLMPVQLSQACKQAHLFVVLFAKTRGPKKVRRSKKAASVMGFVTKIKHKTKLQQTSKISSSICKSIHLSCANKSSSIRSKTASKSAPEKKSHSILDAIIVKFHALSRSRDSAFQHRSATQWPEQ